MFGIFQTVYLFATFYKNKEINMSTLLLEIASTKSKKVVLSDQDKVLLELLNKKSQELNLTIPKCSTCNSACTRCKLKFARQVVYTTKKPPHPKSTLHYFKNKRFIEKFWNNQ